VNKTLWALFTIILILFSISFITANETIEINETLNDSIEIFLEDNNTQDINNTVVEVNETVEINESTTENDTIPQEEIIEQELEQVEETYEEPMEEVEDEIILGEETEEEEFIVPEGYELKERSKYSNTYYDSSSRKYIAELHPRPINYDDGSEFVPMSKNIGGSNLDDYEHGVETGLYKAYFKDENDDEASSPIKLEYKGYTIIFTPDSLKFSGQDKSNKKNSNIKVKNNKATYEDQFGEGIDIEYEYLDYQLKEEIIINSLEDLKDNIKSKPDEDDSLELEFTVRAYDTETYEFMYLKIGDEIINFDEKITDKLAKDNNIEFLDDSGSTIFYFPQPFVYDSSDDKLDLGYVYSVSKSGKLTIELDIPYSWLENADYPIYIDPTTYINVSRNRIGQVESKCNGNWEFSQYDLANIGSSDSSPDKIRRGWMGYNISEINDMVNITSVSLYYYVLGVSEDDCDGNYVNLEFYELDDENYDTTPDNDTAIEEIYDAIGNDSYYGYDLIDSSSQHTWKNENFGSEGVDELQSLINGTATDILLIGLKASEDDESCGSDDCRVDIEEEGVNLPYIRVEYTIVPDIDVSPLSLTFNIGQ